MKSVESQRLRRQIQSRIRSQRGQLAFPSAPTPYCAPCRAAADTSRLDGDEAVGRGFMSINSSFILTGKERVLIQGQPLSSDSNWATGSPTSNDVAKADDGLRPQQLDLTLISEAPVLPERQDKDWEMSPPGSPLPAEDTIM